MTDPIDLDRARAALGYRIPRVFVHEYNRILAAAVDALAEEASAVDSEDSLFDLSPASDLRGPPDGWAVGFEFSLRRRRYSNTPPELIPFGWTGCGGCHYGHVLHAPELPYDDLPVAYFSPTDGVPAGLVGATSSEALANLLAERLEFAIGNREPEEAALICRLHAKLGFDATGFGDERLCCDGDYLPVPPPHHDGYRHIPFQDGIGVFAPQAAFLAEDLDQPRRQDRLPRPLPTDAVAVVRGLVATHPASALLRAKEIWTQIWFHSDRCQEGVDLLTRCYTSLDRDELAARLTDDV